MSSSHEYKMRTKIWLYQGPTPWYFVTLPKKDTTHIKTHYGWLQKGKRGWKSIRVTVKVGQTSWKTSIFPSQKSGSYVLPLKEKVRSAEGLQAGKMVTLSLKID